MNRRDFLRTLGIASSVCALSPLLDLAPISAAPSAALIDVDMAAFNATLKDVYSGLIADQLNQRSPLYEFFKMENIAANADGTLRKSA